MAVAGFSSRGSRVVVAVVVIAAEAAAAVEIEIKGDGRKSNPCRDETRFPI